jgi:hypothetical protein
VADKYLENKLTAPSARELFFKASLLHLCNDVDFLINFYAFLNNFAGCSRMPKWLGKICRS